MATRWVITFIDLRADQPPTTIHHDESHHGIPKSEPSSTAVRLLRVVYGGVGVQAILTCLTKDSQYLSLLLFLQQSSQI